jgi:hypothetical protein
VGRKGYEKIICSPFRGALSVHLELEVLLAKACRRTRIFVPEREPSSPIFKPSIISFQASKKTGSCFGVAEM